MVLIHKKVTSLDHQTNTSDRPKPYNNEMSSNFISLEKLNIIMEKMQYSICKIKYKNCITTGFLCNIPLKGENNKFPVLITCYHLFCQEKIEDEIKISFNKMKFPLIIKSDNQRIFFLNKEYIAFIEIKENDGLEFNNFLELDINNIFEENEFKNIPSYIIQYPETYNVSVSTGIIKKLENHFLYHNCSTKRGSSGSPIINLINHKVIGVHKGYNRRSMIKIGIHLNKKILKIFSKKILELKKKINEPLINSPYKEMSKGININQTLNNSKDSYKAVFDISLFSNNIFDQSFSEIPKQTDNFISSFLEIKPLIELNNNKIKQNLEEIENLYDSLFEEKPNKIILNMDKSYEQKSYDFINGFKFPKHQSNKNSNKSEIIINIKKKLKELLEKKVTKNFIRELTRKRNINFHRRTIRRKEINKRRKRKRRKELIEKLKNKLYEILNETKDKYYYKYKNNLKRFIKGLLVWIDINLSKL